MKRVDGGWLLTDSEVENIVMNQVGIQLGKASVLTIATPREREVLKAMGRAGQSTLLSYQQTPGWLGDACRAELARRAVSK